MVTDTIADSLTRMKNASNKNKEKAVLLKSKMIEEIMRVFKQEDFIDDYEVLEDSIEVYLKYLDEEPLIVEYTRVSKPGRRVYVSVEDLLTVKNGRGISVISTSEGLMTGAQAKASNLGGEYICEIW